MFFEPTAIHNDEQAGLFGEGGGRTVHNAFLQPHSLRPLCDSLFDNRQNLLGLSEDIHEIDGARHLGQ